MTEMTEMAGDLAALLRTVAASGGVARAARKVLDCAQAEETPETVPGYRVPREAIERLRFAVEELDAL